MQAVNEIELEEHSSEIQVAKDNAEYARGLLGEQLDAFRETMHNLVEDSVSELLTFLYMEDMETSQLLTQAENSLKELLQAQARTEKISSMLQAFVSSATGEQTPQLTTTRSILNVDQYQITSSAAVPVGRADETTNVEKDIKPIGSPQGQPVVVHEPPPHEQEKETGQGKYNTSANTEMPAKKRRKFHGLAPSHNNSTCHGARGPR